MSDLTKTSADIPPPLDVDGVRTVTFGTVLWLVAAVVCVATGRHDAALTCVAGFLLGLLGIAYCRRHRSRVAAREVARR